MITKILKNIKKIIKVKDNNLDNITWIEIPKKFSMKNGKIVFDIKR